MYTRRQKLERIDYACWWMTPSCSGGKIPGMRSAGGKWKFDPDGFKDYYYKGKHLTEDEWIETMWSKHGASILKLWEEKDD